MASVTGASAVALAGGGGPSQQRSKQRPSSSSSSGGCAASSGEYLRAATWLTLVGLAATGAAWWFINSGQAADALLRTLVDSDMLRAADERKVADAVYAARAAGLAALVLGGALVGAAGIACGGGGSSGSSSSSSKRAAAAAARRRRASSSWSSGRRGAAAAPYYADDDAPARSAVALAAAGVAGAWLLALSAAALVAVFGGALGAARGADALLGMASGPISAFEASAGDVARGEATLVENLARQALTALGQAPADVAKSSWHKLAVTSVTATFESLQRDLSVEAAGGAPAHGCRPGCVPLHHRGFVTAAAPAAKRAAAGRRAGAPPAAPAAPAAPSTLPACMCMSSSAERARVGAAEMAQALLPAVMGAVLVLLASLALLSRSAAALAAARRDVREARARRVAEAAVLSPKHSLRAPALAGAAGAAAAPPQLAFANSVGSGGLSWRGSSLTGGAMA